MSIKIHNSDDDLILSYVIGFNDLKMRGDSTYDGYIDAVTKKLQDKYKHIVIDRIEVEQRFNYIYSNF